MSETRTGRGPANLTLRQLRAFVHVAREASFSRAAERMHLSPSALSVLVSGLERELGAKLFDRTTRRLEPTVLGREMLARTERLLGEVDDVVRDARDLMARRRGRVSLVTSPLLAQAMLAPVLARFARRQPGIELGLADVPPEQILRRVRVGEADLGVGTFDQEDPGVVQTVLHRDTLMLACAPEHPWRGRAEVAWAALAGEPLIVLNRGSGLRRLVDRTLAAAGVEWHPAFEVEQVATAIALVQAGLGVSPLPTWALAVSGASRALTVVPLVRPRVHRSVVVLRAAERSLSPAAQALHDHLVAQTPAMRRAGRLPASRTSGGRARGISRQEGPPGD